MISKIDSFQEVNNYIVSRLTKDSQYILPLDKYTHHALTNDQVELMRSAANDETSYDEFCRSYTDLFGEVSDIGTYAFTGYSISKTEAKRYVVYPFSKTHLYTSLYSDILPSIFSNYFIIFKKNDRIRQFGTGVGKALIIDTDPFTKSDFESLSNLSYKDTVDLMIVVSEQIAKQNTDIEYLLKKIDVLSKEKDILSNEVDRLNQLVINTSITTWR